MVASIDTRAAGAYQLTTPSPRTFPAPPAPYVHPRVFTTAQELSQIKANLTSPGYGDRYGQWLFGTVRGASGDGSFLRQLSQLDITIDSVTEAHLNDFYFAYGEGSGQRLAVMALWGAVFEDGDALYIERASETAIGAAFNFAILAEHVERRFRTNDYSGLSGDTQSKITRHWDNHDQVAPRLGQIWQNGGTGLPLAYDMLYNDMTIAQQDQIRRALVIATADWLLMGSDDTNGLGGDGNISNWVGYQGDYIVQMAAIYGEDGFSTQRWDEASTWLRNYLRSAFTTGGASGEDSYGPNLGLREGSRGLIALARQGINEFADRPGPMYNIGSFIAHDLEAVPGGSLIGGESGGNYAITGNAPSGTSTWSMYPSSIINWKYVYPDDPVIDYAYQRRIGANYDGNLRWQGMVDYAYHGQPHMATTAAPLQPMIYWPERGKMIARNDSTEQAVQFSFDARPEASSIGHDKAGRGFFNLNGLGRRWVTHVDFRQTRVSTESSTMHIDGVGQAYKTPSVHVVEPATDDGLVVSMVADLEYAYDWQWNEPWTWSASDSPRPSAGDWEIESTDPRTFFTQAPAPLWMSNTLWDDINQGLFGMWMWRRPHIGVERAFRSVAYVRAEKPFVIIADDINKDGGEHRYESYIQLPFDIDQMSVNGNDAILWASGDNRRLLVRVVGADITGDAGVSFEHEAYTTSVTPIDARRLVIGVDAVNPQLKVMLMPHYDGDALPPTSLTANGSRLNVGEVSLDIDISSGYPVFRSGLPEGDVNCDATSDIIDALMIAQHSVNIRGASYRCPLGQDQLYLPAADPNGDGTADVIDALLIAQCAVGIPNTLCP